MEISLKVFSLDDLEVQAKSLLDLCSGAFSFEEVREIIQYETFKKKETIKHLDNCASENFLRKPKDSGGAE